MRLLLAPLIKTFIPTHAWTKRPVSPAPPPPHLAAAPHATRHRHPTTTQLPPPAPCPRNPKHHRSELTIFIPYNRKTYHLSQRKKSISHHHIISFFAKEMRIFAQLFAIIYIENISIIFRLIRTKRCIIIREVLIFVETLCNKDGKSKLAMPIIYWIMYNLHCTWI